MKKKIKTIGIAIGILLLLLIIGMAYSMFVKPTTITYAKQNVIGLIIFGLFLGAGIAFLIFKLMQKKTPSSNTVVSSHTVVESMRRVFKIVCAEGQLNEIYNYENTKKLLRFIPSTKKALVIVRAKVLIGYDFEKCKWDVDEENKKIKLLSFPRPEVLSIEPEFNYYYIEDDLFNFIGRKDLEQIQELAKAQAKKAAQKSGLINIASEQMKVLLKEVFSANQWQIENMHKIDAYKYLPEPEEESTIEEAIGLINSPLFNENVKD